MGCSNHFMLQKRLEDGTWQTVDTDICHMPSSVARTFNQFAGSFCDTGLPLDVVNTARVKTIKGRDGLGGSSATEYYLDGYYLGEHSIGYTTLETLVSHKDSLRQPERVSFETGSQGEISIYIEPPCADDPQSDVLQKIEALESLYPYALKQYRLVMGYDS